MASNKQGRIVRGIDKRAQEVVNKRSAKILQEVANLEKLIASSEGPIYKLTNPRQVVIQLIEISREMVIRNNPKILALYLILEDEDNRIARFDSGLLDVEGFYTEDEERAKLLDKFFWQTPPSNVEVGRSRVWDAFQAYNKKILRLLSEIEDELVE